MINCLGLGQIIVALIRYADDEDIKQFIKYCFPKPTQDGVNKTGAETYKEYFIHQLCIAEYNFYECICEENLVRFRNTIKKSKYDLIILHLKALYESYSEKLTMLTFNYKDIINPQKIDIINDLAETRKELKKALEDRYLSGNDIRKLLHIIIENYAEHHLYYINEDYKIVKLEIESYMETYQIPDTEIKRSNKKYRVKKTIYNINKHQRYSTLVNTETKKKYKINVNLEPFYTNSKGDTDIKLIDMKDFEKINSEIIKAISKI